jgi:VWFA-related protein
MTRTPSRLLALASAMAATVTAVAQQPLFRAGVEMVRVDVSVVRGGAPVTGLRLEDFEVRDQGVRQQLTGFLYEEVPLEGYLVLDASASVTGQKLIDLRRAAMAFLAGLRAGDQAALLTFSQAVAQHQPLTSDLAAVRRALEAVTTGGTTALHDALFAAMLQRRPNERRAVAVVFSDGLENVSWLSEADVLGTAERSDMVVYGVTLTPEPRGGWEQPQMSSPAPPSDSYATGRMEPSRTLSPEYSGRAPAPVENAFLRRVTAATGGRIWAAGSSAQLEEAFVAVLRDIRSRYLLTYTPGSPPRQGWHPLQVKLKRGKGQVIARPGYFVR